MQANLHLHFIDVLKLCHRTNLHFIHSLHPLCNIHKIFTLLHICNYTWISDVKCVRGIQIISSHACFLGLTVKTTELRNAVEHEGFIFPITFHLLPVNRFVLHAHFWRVAKYEVQKMVRVIFTSSTSVCESA